MGRLNYPSSGTAKIISAEERIAPSKGFMLSPFARDEAEKLANSMNHKESGCLAK